MSARLGQYRMLWQAAHAQIHPRAQTVLWSAVVILTVAVASLMGAVYGVLTGLGWALCTSAGLMLFDWTMAFVPGALGLNTPANAQLVPAMRARLVELVLLVWLAAVGLLAAGLQLIPAASHLVLPFTMAGTLGVTTLFAGVGAGLVLMLPFFFPYLTEGWQGWLRDAAAQPGVMPLLAAAMVLPVVPVVRALFPRGGERHWAMREHLARLSGGSGSSAMFDEYGALFDPALPVSSHEGTWCAGRAAAACTWSEPVLPDAVDNHRRGAGLHRHDLARARHGHL